MSNGWRPTYGIFHDYGGTPKNVDGVFNPYHALIFPDGSVRYRYPDNPYGQPAPHAYRLNPVSVGISYAGPVGSTPTEQAMAALRREYERVNQLFPGITWKSHGEAYRDTKGTPWQASKLGRGLEEASWRTALRDSPPARSALADRAFTTWLGMSPPKKEAAITSAAVTDQNLLRGSRWDDGTPESALPDPPQPTPVTRTAPHDVAPEARTMASYAPDRASYPTLTPREERSAAGSRQVAGYQPRSFQPSSYQPSGYQWSGYQPATWEWSSDGLKPVFASDRMASRQAMPAFENPFKKLFGWA